MRLLEVEKIYNTRLKLANYFKIQLNTKLLIHKKSLKYLVKRDSITQLKNFQ